MDKSNTLDILSYMYLWSIISDTWIQVSGQWGMGATNFNMVSTVTDLFSVEENVVAKKSLKPVAPNYVG